MRPLARGLEAAAAALGVLALAILVTGGWTLAGVPLTRAEDVVVALAAVLGARALVAPLALPVPAPARAVAIGVGVYVLAMGFIVVSRHLALRTHALDLGYYVQVVWNIARGDGARVTLPPMHAWGDHFSPVLYLFAPLGWVGGVAPGLLLAQTALFAAGAFAVFGFVRRRLGAERPALGFAVLYLVNPSLHGINLRDVHPAAFAIPLLVAAALAFDAGRYRWCLVALVLTLAGREDAAVAVTGFAVWLAVARGRWVVGAALAAASVGVLFVDVTYLMPHFRGEAYPHLGRYAHLGGSLGQILLGLAAPWRWLPGVLTAPKLVYLVLMLAPLGFLPLLAPRAAAAALPGLAMNLLSADPVLYHHRAQYQAYVLPFLVLAAVEGYGTLGIRLGARRLLGRFGPAAALAVGFVASVALTARTVNDLSVGRWRLGDEQRAAHALMRRVPPTAPVSANERLVPHLATRREVYIFPAGVGRSEWVLTLEGEVRGEPAVGYREVARAGPWVLLRRG